MSVITDIIGSIPTYHAWRQVGGYNRLNSQYKVVISRRFDGIGESPSLLDIDGYSSSPISLSTGFSDKDLFDNIAGSKVTIRMYAESIDQLLPIARGDDTRYRAVLTEGGITLFQGYLRPETYRQEYERNRPVVTVDATDGIGLLRNVEFMGELDDYSDLAGNQKVREIISYLLWKAGNYNNWQDRIYYRLIGHVDDNLLRHLEMPVWKYYGWTCYDVLVDILRIFNAQLVQVGGVFRIRLADQPYPNVANSYNYTGTHQYIVSGDDKEPINIHDELKGVQGDIRIERPVRRVNFKAPQVAVGELIYNGDLDGPKGWSGWGNISDGMWGVEDHILTMESDINIDQPYYGVQTNISRGAITGVQYIRLMFEAKSEDGLVRIYVSINDGAIQDTGTTTLWVDKEFEFTIPGGAEDVYIRFRTPTTSNLHIKNISAVPLYVNKEEIQNISNDSEETINEKSQQDITHEIKYAWGGNPYRFENTFPSLPGKLSQVYSRINDVSSTPEGIQKARVLAFFGSPRMRVGVDAYKDGKSIKIDDILYDKHYKRSYVITSLQYDMAAAKYSVEALEHERMFINEGEEDDWILAGGVWNDDGYWRDEAQWIDSL